MVDGSGVDGEVRASGKVAKVELVRHLGRGSVVELAMRAGEDPLRVEEGKEEATGVDQLQEEHIKVVRIVREEVKGNNRAETSDPGEFW